ncbi:type II toxin-antitoxin system prevent-host-death family antitoxin [Candidatus Poriferisocius sp.]|uniref:type II toxin-antitoxin system prevent-host-death family antitoxin n=1 Tax=Candidatus Poriferisocius sp. TaxID=3101276 RepID=UPI003B02CAA8
MVQHSTDSHGIWTVADAKARLSQVLRRAEEEGPQRIGTRKTFVVVPEHVWEARAPSSVPLGQWLVKSMPRGYNLELPDRGSDREIPFSYCDDEGL